MDTRTGLKSYTQLLRTAIKDSKKLGLSPRISSNTSFDLETTIPYVQLLSEYLYRALGSLYWGEQCLNLAAQSFAHLHLAGLPVDIVYGDVLVDGQTFEFDTTLKGLKKEYYRGVSDQNMNIHAWVTIGNDIILDFGMPSRLKRHYDPNVNPYYPIYGAAEGISKNKLQYIPMLVGQDYLIKTCGKDILQELVELADAD